MKKNKSVLTLKECEEKQRNEFEALHAIYYDCKILDLRKKVAWKVHEPLELQISLLPSGGESNNETFVSIDLYVKCPPNYPMQKPHLDFRNAIGLEEHQVKDLGSILDTMTESLVGEVMIHDLCSQVRSFLYRHNKPPKESCYAEMMKTKLKKEKETLDEIEKREQEKCYNEKLQAQVIEQEIKKRQEEFKKAQKKGFTKKTKIDAEEVVENKQLFDDHHEASDKISELDVSCKEDKDFKFSGSELDTGSRLLNDFEILEKIGHGAFGDVIKVQNLLDGRHYAIKRIPLNFRNKAETRRITREVKFLSRLNHENVVRYYNSWIETSYKFITANPPNCHSNSNNQVSGSQDSGSLESTKDDSFEGSNFSPNEKRVHSDSITESCCSDSINSLHGEAQESSEDENSESVIFLRDGSEDSEAEYKSDKVKKPFEKEDVSKRQFLYIQMEFCDKSTLRDCIDRGLHKDLNLVWLLFREIVEGIIHIHDQGIIHRDLKPVNIFLDTNNHVKIGDFGLATVASKSLDHFSQDNCSMLRDTSHHQIDESLTSNVGTALYVSPEVVNGKLPYNQKVDLYSLGIIFFEMSYKPLVTGMERNKILSLVREASIKFPSDFDDLVQSSQKHIITWLLNHDPTKRPSAKELLASDLFPLLPSEEHNLDRAIVSAVKNVNSHAHKNLMSTIFSQKTSAAVEFSYDYMFTKGLNYSLLLEINLIREHVIEQLEKIFIKHGAVNFDIPLLMPRHNIYSDSNQEVLLMNHSGGVIALPYDSKVPFARYVEKHNISSTKRFSINKIFREHHISELHPKELWECSYDVITSSSELSLNCDAEVILIIQEIIQEFPGLSEKFYQLELNHIGFITAIMISCQIPMELHHDIFSIFKEYNNIDQQKFHLLARLSNIGLDELVIKKFLTFIQKEGSVTEISNFLKCLPYTKGTDLSFVKHGLNYLENLLKVLDKCENKFEAKISLKLCSNFHIYSGLSFQISRTWKKKVDVLASGGCYDCLFNNFRQLGKHSSTKRHGVGVSISLEKIICAVRSFKTINVNRPILFQTVDVLIASTKPKSYCLHMIQAAQIFWNIGLSSKLYDEDGTTLDIIKNCCKVNKIQYLVLLDSENMLIKIDSNEKEQLIYKEIDQNKFSDFLRKKFQKNGSDAMKYRKPNALEQNNTQLESLQYHEVRLVGYAEVYKDAAKVLDRLSAVLSKFSNCHVVVLVAEISKTMLKAIASQIEIKDETTLVASMASITKEFPKNRKYILRLTEDLISHKFRNSRY